MAGSRRVEKPAIAHHVGGKPSIIDALFMLVDKDEGLRWRWINNIGFPREDSVIILACEWTSTHPPINRIAAHAGCSLRVALVARAVINRRGCVVRKELAHLDGVKIR